MTSYEDREVNSWIEIADARQELIDQLKSEKRQLATENERLKKLELRKTVTRIDIVQDGVKEFWADHWEGYFEDDHRTLKIIATGDGEGAKAERNASLANDFANIYPWGPSDFVTHEFGKVYPFIEDEDAYGVYGYGHLAKEWFVDQVNDYDILMGGWGEDDLYAPCQVQHLWAVASPDLPDERFTWKDVTSRTPGAFPITVIIR